MTDETREESQSRTVLMQSLRDMIARRKKSAPGTHAIEVPLDKIFHFVGLDGDDKAVMPVEEVLYLVDEILRR